MENLPAELVSRIPSFLAKPDIRCFWIREPAPSLTAYAVISRQWQQAVERLTFQDLVLTPHELAVSQDGIRLTATRLAHVRCISLFFEVPVHNPAVSTDPDDFDDQIVFNKTI
ncbi:hypothetical protein EDB81DRAFT_886313 [Dactylonectria macrodidyma]|uniref:F-box domain-containing protein n=1 Tax=Dactylonectria macrodidyma TaxID=307937 RepID=A0A9P9ED87_9HYPO|nr:hypothetical protein EDB81DRAFT_886313 [Dactylonectria macrodidyma]